MRGYGSRFERLYTAAVGTRFGDSARTSAVAVIGAQLTSSPALLSCVSAMTFAPWLLFGLPAGALVDRLNKRRAFLMADAARCVAVLALVWLAFAGYLTLPWLIVGVFVLTTLQTVSDSCFTSLLPSVVNDRDLGPANARLSASQSTAGVVGPPAGSFLASVGAGWPFVLNALTFGASAAWVASLPPETGRPDERSGPRRRGALRSLLRDVADGIRHVRQQRLLPLLLGSVAVSNLCNGINTSVLPLLATHTLGVSVSSYGVIIAANAACMVIGNLVAGSCLRRGVPTTALARIAIAVKLPGFALVGLAPSFTVVCVGMALLGFGAGMWNVPSSTLMMRSAPREVIGRTSALFRTVSVAGMPLGALLGGLVATLGGLRFSALTAGVFTAVLLVYFSHRVRLLPRQEGEVKEPSRNDG